MPIFILIASYYALLALCVFCYIRNRNKNTLNIRDVVYALTFITTSVGGVFSSYGFASMELCPIRYNILFCYISFFVILTISFSVIGKESVFEFGKKLDFIIGDRAVWIIYLIILVYSLAFFAFLGDNIPLINLIKSGDVASAIIARLEVTHDLTEYYDVPFVFRYAKFVRETPMFLLTCIAYLKYREGGHKMMFYVILLTTIFYQIYALEKAGVIYIIIMLYFCNVSVKERVSLISFRLMIPIVLIGASIYIMYSFFMGQDEGVLENISNRIFLRQTGWIYFQDEILESQFGGCLFGGGISIFLIDSLLGRSPISLSQELYLDVYSQYGNAGYVGTTGGMPMFYFYSNFGLIIGCLIFYLMCCVIAKIDYTLSKSIVDSKNKHLSIAVQATFLCLCIQGFMGSMTTVFMLPFIWSPQVFALILTVIGLNKISKCVVILPKDSLE